MSKKKHTSPPLITLEQPKSLTSEQFRGIRTNLSFSSVDTKLHTLVITAEKPQAGKSTITSNIAITYAQAGYKTLIMDGDMREPTQHYIFNTQNTHGLSTLISNVGELANSIADTEVENLYLLPAGPVPPNPSELIISKKFSEIFKHLQTEYDVIIIDTPPMNSVTDAQILAEYAKNSVLVIDVNKNNKNEIKRAQRLLEKAGSKILGVILNKVKTKTKDYNYYYGET